MNDEEKQTRDKAPTTLPEGGEGEGAGPNSLDQDDIARLLAQAEEENQEEENQEQGAAPSKGDDNDQASAGQEEGPAEALEEKELPEENESSFDRAGSEGLEEDEAAAQADEEFLAQLEVLEDEQPEEAHHDGPEEDERDVEDISVEAEFEEAPASDDEETESDKDTTGDVVQQDKTGEEEGLFEEAIEVTEEDQGEEKREDEEGDDTHGVDVQGDEGSKTEDEDSHDQEGGDNRQQATAEGDVQKEDEAVASGPEEDGSSAEEKEGAEEERSGDDEDEDGPEEQDQDVETPETLNEKGDGADENGVHEDVEEGHPPKRGKKALLLVVGLLSCVTVAAGMAGWVLYKRYVPESTKGEERVPVQERNVSDGETKPGPTQPVPSLDVRGPATLVEELGARLQEALDLRDRIVVKLREIDRLKRHFYQSIGKTEMEIYREIGKGGITSFGQALNNKRIELGLRTIQRREAYVRQLDQPSEWLEKGGQELLYVRRKTMVDMEASKIAGDIDLKGLITDLEGVIQKNRSGMESLSVDMGTAKLHSLETIWERLKEEENPLRRGETNIGKRRHKGQVHGYPFKKEGRDNEIWEELCNGDYGRKGELTQLSVQAAKCLANVKVSDLFLNSLTQLTPEAAKYLMKWEGNWICLNGLKQILPETGKSLFQWQGNVISLNGLSRFPPEVAPLLLNWQGGQLELMGLEPSGDMGQLAGIKALAQWEASGGKLYVPGDVRRQIDHINGESGS
ncbi:MAG: hypothetical protein SWE60_04965 [Thermodesulfobacteriota bacterium]|nr:hypothetical protein [Thermodesulfobacteriota bacterium]